MFAWSDLWRLFNCRCTHAMVYIWLVLVAMANNVDRDEYREVSHVRTGLKREFAFALESTAQHASSIGDKCSSSRHGVNDEENLEMSGSGNTILKKIPRKLKDLLETGLLEGTPVQYQYGPKTKGKTGLKGIVRGTGIACSCPDCNGIRVVSPNEFEMHAQSRNKRPADYIFLENGYNLHAVLNACTNAALEALESIIQVMIGCTSSSAEQNVFCPTCKSSISGEEMLCSSCKETSTQCALCRGHDFSTSKFGPRTIIFCDQCEKEYHVSCLKEHDMDDLEELPEGKWFCCKDCSRIHSVLEDRVAIGDDFLPESIFNDLKPDVCISWRLLSGRRSIGKANKEYAMLSKAESIFHDRFKLVEDSNSGLSDFISHMVFGREVRDQDFRGMYCAVLKVNSEIVSAAIIRVFGEGMAELPLIADERQKQEQDASTDCIVSGEVMAELPLNADSTESEKQKQHASNGCEVPGEGMVELPLVADRTENQEEKQGYFKVLLSCLELLLQSLKVKKLVLPAADKESWIKTYNFSNISKEELENYQKDYQMVAFRGTTMLQKTIAKS